MKLNEKLDYCTLKKKLTQRQSDGWRDFFQHLYIQSGIKLILLILIRVEEQKLNLLKSLWNSPQNFNIHEL